MLVELAEKGIVADPITQLLCVAEKPFGQVKPCTSMIEVKGLIDPGYLIEIEATAIIT